MIEEHEIITGERLQAIADVTVITPEVYAFHTSLGTSGVKKLLALPDGRADPAELARTIDRPMAVFVYTHLLDRFIATVAPSLRHPIVLMTHNSDHLADRRYQELLEAPWLLHWFAQNLTFRHPRATALPIGIANAQWPHGDTRILASVAGRSAKAAREPVLYANFEVATNPVVREPLKRQLEGRPFVRASGPRPWPAYLAEMAKCRWALSPPGNGTDCHRTWECLYLGVTPVVGGGEDGGVHDGLGVLRFDDLATVTPEALEEVGNERIDPSDSVETATKLRLSTWKTAVQKALVGNTQ